MSRRKLRRETAEIISIINQKGGVAKSTTAAGIAGGLLSKGSRVLMIDLDPQLSLSLITGADLNAPNIAHLLDETSTAAEVVQHTETGDIIAGHVGLTEAEKVMTGPGSECILRDAIEPLGSSYDFIIIDTPPALSILTLNALTASTSAIIPAQADLLSQVGIGQLSETLHAVKHSSNPKLRVLGVLLTRHNPRANLSKEMTTRIRETAAALDSKVFTSYIRECISIKEAQAFGQSVYKYAPRSNAVKDYKSVVDEILTEI